MSEVRDLYGFLHPEVTPETDSKERTASQCRS